ncbi:PcfJ domain-containing protein [Allochromatium tepidum]|uniref:Uncharacterized protein n=1 Tax=Allochromatium tepidum TaxID=553982 RepID=A0ABN6GJ16_9GAMM|nr:PcfJ domain-containing protein [Allochromatium tepidum]BCU08390.1 hypothetical protein Atep_30670 [Allochromatium tepidum]
MRPDGQPFEHWSYRRIGDPGLNAASVTLLNRLLSEGRLGAPRAWLMRRGLPVSVRQALRVDFTTPTPLAGQPGRYHRLWLVEQADRQVFAYGVERPNASLLIGGRVLRGWPALDPESPWLMTLAEHLADAVLDHPNAHRASPAGPSEHWMLTQVEAALCRAALGEWLSALDAERLAVIRAEGTPTPEVFNDYGAGDETTRTRRLQAAQTFPAYAGVLRTEARLRRAVIAGEPLQRALANHFQVKPRTIARTRSLRDPRIFAARRTRLQRLDRWPAEYLPRTEADWAPCLALAERLDTLATCLDVEPIRLIKPFRHGWADGLQALTQQVGTRLDVDALFEMMQAAWHYGVRPALIDWANANGLDETAVPLQPPCTFFPRWFGRSGLARLMTLAQEWRTARLAFSLARADADPETAEPLTWPAWTPGSHTQSDYRILELTSQADLEHEGLRLAHCVGTYAGECLLHAMGIYAVRDRHGQSCSTFEVQMTESGPLLVQHQATANTEPSAAERALVAHFIARVLAAVPPERVRAVCAEREAIAAEASAWMARLAELEEEGALQGELDPEQAAELAERIRGLHPPEVRRLGLTAVLQPLAPGWLGLKPSEPTRTPDPSVTVIDSDDRDWDLAA